MSRPNIVYIHSHDTGRYIQPYGYAVPTPNLQRLAEEGVVFRQAFCAGPLCSPSRASLVTGEYPHSNGMMGLAQLGWYLNDYKHHLVHTLRKAGYQSHLIGFQHVVDWPEVDKIGYDTVTLNGITPHVRDVAPAAVEFLSRGPRRPFFLSMGTLETHRLWVHFDETGPKGDPRYCRPPASVPDVPQTRRDMADFIECARRFDEGVGAVLDAIDSAGLGENTLVIAAADHGLPFPNMKCTLTDHGLGVYLILRGPGGFRGGNVLDAAATCSTP